MPASSTAVSPAASFSSARIRSLRVMMPASRPPRRRSGCPGGGSAPGRAAGARRARRRVIAVGMVATLAIHDLADAMDVERIDGVFAEDVMAAPGDLLGEDRAAQQQHGDGVRARRRRPAAPGSSVPVVGQLAGEDASRSAASASCRPSSRPCRPSPRGRRRRGRSGDGQGAERAAHHEQRREHAAGRARAQRDRPDDAPSTTSEPAAAPAGTSPRSSAVDRCRSRRRGRAGRCRPPMPTPRPPIAGHHIQWIGSFAKRSSQP